MSVEKAMWLKLGAVVILGTTAATGFGTDLQENLQEKEAGGQSSTGGQIDAATHEKIAQIRKDWENGDKKNFEELMRPKTGALDPYIEALKEGLYRGNVCLVQEIKPGQAEGAVEVLPTKDLPDGLTPFANGFVLVNIKRP